MKVNLNIIWMLSRNRLENVQYSLLASHVPSMENYSLICFKRIPGCALSFTSKPAIRSQLAYKKHNAILYFSAIVCYTAV